MKSQEHKTHIAQRTSHAACSECRADRERRFVDTSVWRYGHVHDYLKWIKPRLKALRNGADSVDARIWQRKFRLALDRRISLKVPTAGGRKYCDSYLERLGNMRNADETYLVRYATRGASCLDY